MLASTPTVARWLALSYLRLVDSLSVSTYLPMALSLAALDDAEPVASQLAELEPSRSTRT